MTEVFNIQKIQNLEPGWEREWHLLLESLLFDEEEAGPASFKEDYATSGPLGRLCFQLLDFDQKWRLEDFVFFVCDQYCKRVERQTLFAKFDPEKGNPIQFLCSPKYLACYLKKFLTPPEMVALPVLAQENGNDADEPVSGELPDEKSLKPEKVIEQREMIALYKALTSAMVINCPKAGTRIYEQAGLQLYEKLSEDDKQMIRLKTDARQNVANIHEITEIKADSKICAFYDADSMEIEEEIIRLEQKLRKNRYRSDVNHDKDRQKMIHLTKKYIFSPLSNRSLEVLMQMSAENVARCLSRYLEKLPELCDGYQKKFEEILLETEADDE